MKRKFQPPVLGAAAGSTIAPKLKVPALGQPVHKELSAAADSTAQPEAAEQAAACGGTNSVDKAATPAAAMPIKALPGIPRLVGGLRRTSKKLPPAAAAAAPLAAEVEASATTAAAIESTAAASQWTAEPSTHKIAEVGVPRPSSIGPEATQLAPTAPLATGAVDTAAATTGGGGDTAAKFRPNTVCQQQQAPPGLSLAPIGTPTATGQVEQQQGQDQGQPAQPTETQAVTIMQMQQRQGPEGQDGKQKQEGQEHEAQEQQGQPVARRVYRLPAVLSSSLACVEEICPVASIPGARELLRSLPVPKIAANPVPLLDAPCYGDLPGLAAALEDELLPERKQGAMPTPAPAAGKTRCSLQVLLGMLDANLAYADEAHRTATMLLPSLAGRATMLLPSLAGRATKMQCDRHPPAVAKCFAADGAAAATSATPRAAAFGTGPVAAASAASPPSLDASAGKPTVAGSKAAVKAGAHAAAVHRPAVTVASGAASAMHLHHKLEPPEVASRQPVVDAGAKPAAAAGPQAGGWPQAGMAMPLPLPAWVKRQILEDHRIPLSYLKKLVMF